MGINMAELCQTYWALELALHMPREKNGQRRQESRLVGMVRIIGAKPNLYCEAIELVCGGSPKICVLVERKSRLRVK